MHAMHCGYQWNRFVLILLPAPGTLGQGYWVYLEDQSIPRQGPRFLSSPPLTSHRLASLGCLVDNNGLLTRSPVLLGGEERGFYSLIQNGKAKRAGSNFAAARRFQFGERFGYPAYPH